MFSEFKRFVSEVDAFGVLLGDGEILVEILGLDCAVLGDRLILRGVKDAKILANLCEWNAGNQGRPATFWAKGPVNTENDCPGDHELPRMSGPY